MAAFRGIDPALLNAAVYDARWASVARAHVDLPTINTWDAQLWRGHRILVPVDVAAYVVPARGAEPTVDVGGLPTDPAPFSAGAPRAPGVHLHWAMPDALLRGEEGEPRRLTMPPLPDRWVVVRTLLPIGARRALVHGWVIDAASGHVTPLSQFDGAHAGEQPAMQALSPLDGASGGSLMWTASYVASHRRFALHDPLSDIPALADEAPSGLHGDNAVYTVAGWWTDADLDPLHGATGPAALDARLSDLGWFVDHEADDAGATPDDPGLARREQRMGYVSPAQDPPVDLVTPRRVERYAHLDLAPGAATPMRDVSRIVVGPGLPTYTSLLHGSVIGVPIDGTLPPADDRPRAGSVTACLGEDVDDVLAAASSRSLGLSGAAREAFEQALAAFAGGVLDRLSSADGLVDLAEREHAEGFWSFRGPALAQSAPDRLRVEDSAKVGPTTVGRKGRAEAAPKQRATPATTPELRLMDTSVSWRSGSVLGMRHSVSPAPLSTPIADVVAKMPLGESRTVDRTPPRLFRPQAPVVALRGAKPSHRHHDDGLYDERGLWCRYPTQAVRGIDGVVTGASILPTLGSGALPGEVLTVVREAVLLDGYAAGWLSAAGAAPSPSSRNRVLGEMARIYGTTGTYDPSGATALTAEAVIGSPDRATRASVDAWASRALTERSTALQLAAEVARFSALDGSAVSPIGLRTWRQPWVPLWLEWRVTLTGSGRMRGWHLGDVDLEPHDETGGPGADVVARFVGRSPISEGVADLLQDAVSAWIDSEEQRELTQSSLSSSEVETLTQLSGMRSQLDLVSASLDGVREQLLGIGYVGQVERGDPEETGEKRPIATGLPMPLFGGSLRVDALRLVDAFGRTLDIGVESVPTTTRLELPDEPAGIRLRPRVQHAARWLFRLVDPAHPAGADPAIAPEAFVDQIRPDLAVNPVAGFLLPDHVDEALEVFDAGGVPLGQLMHDTITGAVRWETAPGRPLPPDSGPMDALSPAARIVGRLATGVVLSDVAAREAAAASVGGASGGDDPAAATSSSLSSLLRAIDTTLWSVDTFAAIGSASVAGLVGRPIAVVRATLRLDAPDDLDEVHVTEPGGAAARLAAFAALSEQAFPVRLGDITRADDGLLGFFVDDDYRRFHLVDKVVSAHAWESGRHRGYLGLLGSSVSKDPLEHPYLAADDTVLVRPGQTVRLTLLMLPAGTVHLTSGLLPKKSLTLADDWVRRGLTSLSPSLRVGPVLVDPGEVRMPLAHHLGESQTFTRRTAPLTWRDDPIMAATQSALLPRLPHEVHEGWVRVTPEEGQS